MQTKDIIKLIIDLPEDQIDSFIAKRIEYLTKNCATKTKFLAANGAETIIYNGFIVPHNQMVSIDWYNHNFKVDDLETMYGMMVEEIKKSEPKTVEEIFKSVATVVYDYVGGPYFDGTMQDRFSHITPEDDLPLDKYNVISQYKNTKHAACVERSIIAHELLYMLGFNANVAFLESTINDNAEIHCVNLVKGNEKAYILDTSLINSETPESVYNPIAVEGKVEDIVKMKNLPSRKTKNSDGESIEIKYNPNNRHVLDHTSNSSTPQR